jgi:hypothetical protein
LKAGYLIASHRNLNLSFLNFQVAIDAASIPKDAKIAVLEKSSTESEKKIAGKSFPVPSVSVVILVTLMRIRIRLIALMRIRIFI